MSSPNKGSRSLKKSLVTLLPAIVSVPLAFLLSLVTTGDQITYIVSVASLGVLASLDLRKGPLRLGLAFAVSLLAMSYVIGNSVVGQGLPTILSGDMSAFLVSLPPSIGILLPGLLFSRSGKYHVLRENILGSATVAVGLGIGLLSQASASSDSALFSMLYYAGLGFGGNALLMGLLYLMGKFWASRTLSFTIMPTACFAYNSLSVLGYVASQETSQLYSFLSSLAFLPALILAGAGSGTIAKKMPAVIAGLVPRITVTGSSMVRQGGDEEIKIETEAGGSLRNMASVEARITRPSGKVESLKVSRVSQGEYKALFRPNAPGNYSVRVNAVSKGNAKANESFGFNVQAPPSQPISPPPRPFTQVRPALARPVQPAQPPVQRPVFSQPQPSQQRPVLSTPPSTPSRIDSWDPRVWVNQEVHGYKIKELVASGLSGYILRASFVGSASEVALKIPILRSGQGTTALDETMSEASKLLEISQQSKYVVQLRGILVDRFNVQEIVKGNTALYLKNPPAIVMEFMNGGAAKRLLEDPEYESLYYSEKWGSIVVVMGSMIAQALETIHKDGFVHLDVKPQNILFNSKPPTTGSEMLDQMKSGTLVPKLADLGSAVRIGGKVQQFTSEYAPGEQIIVGTAASSMDVYALGATLYSMLSKTPINSKKLIDAMNAEIRNPGTTRGLSDLKNTWNLFTADFAKVDTKFAAIVPALRRMLDKDAGRRPSAGEVATTLRNLRA